MSVRPPHPDASVRDRVLDALSLFRLHPALARGRPDLGPERIAYALLRHWMEDVFEPGLRTMDGIRGDRGSDAEARFRAAFDEEEWIHLERFHRFVELRVGRLGPEAHARGTYPADDSWHGIVRDARHTVALLGEDPDERSARLLRRAGPVAGFLP